MKSYPHTRAGNSCGKASKDENGDDANAVDPLSYMLLISCAAAFFVFGMTSSIIGPTIGDLAAAIGITVAAAGLLRSGRQLVPRCREFEGLTESS